MGENDVEAILERLDRLTQEEARTTATQTLEVVYGLMKNIKVVMDGARTFPVLIMLYECCPSDGNVVMDAVHQTLGMSSS